jgi:hypothetical protein
VSLFQKIPATDQLPYFRIADIHGFPLVSWDGVTDPAGYCRAHQQLGFPAWNRLYVEQRLVTNTGYLRSTHVLGLGAHRGLPFVPSSPASSIFLL